MYVFLFVNISSVYIFQFINHKSLDSNALLSVVGHLSLQMLNSKDKTVQSIVLAQTPPSLLE